MPPQLATPLDVIYNEYVCVAAIFSSDRRREGCTPEQTRSTFGELFQRLRDEQVREVDMLFCGPNVAASLHRVQHAFSHDTPADTRNVTEERNDDGNIDDDRRGQPPLPLENHRSNVSALAVTLRFDCGLYHDVAGSFASPDAMFLFNAGLWGYDDWLPTLEHIIFGRNESRGSDASRKGGSEHSCGKSALGVCSPAGVVVTSYCAEEAEDDMETVEQLLLSRGRRTCVVPTTTSRTESDSAGGSCSPSDSADRLDGGPEWLWKPEVNPYRSMAPRQTSCGVAGRVLFENHSWQAIRP